MELITSEFQAFHFLQQFVDFTIIIDPYSSTASLSDCTPLNLFVKLAFFSHYWTVVCKSAVRPLQTYKLKNRKTPPYQSNKPSPEPGHKNRPQKSTLNCPTKTRTTDQLNYYSQ